MSKETVVPTRGPSDFSRTGYMVHCSETPMAEASFTMAILERWAMVQGKDGGEDSAGRSKIGLMPVNETVERACEIADKAFATFRERGWMLDVPSMDDLEDQLQERENKKENRGR